MVEKSVRDLALSWDAAVALATRLIGKPVFVRHLDLLITGKLAGVRDEGAYVALTIKDPVRQRQQNSKQKAPFTASEYLADKSVCLPYEIDGGSKMYIVLQRAESITIG